MNHPSRETCRSCGAELVYNPRQAGVSSSSPSSGSKIIVFAALFMALLMATGFGLYSLGEFDRFFLTAKKSPEEIEREKESKAREIWDKHLEISGEKNNPQPKNIIMKGAVTLMPKPAGPPPARVPAMPNIHGNMEYYYKSPGKIYSRVELSLPGNSRQAPQTIIVQRFFDGEKGWEKKTQFERRTGLNLETVEANRTETTEQLSEEAIEELKNEVFSRMTEGYKNIKYNGTAAVDGKQHHRLFGKRSNGYTDTLYVDAETFLVSKIEFEKKPSSKPDEVISDATFSDYRAVNNLQTPFSLHMTTRNLLLQTALSEVVYDGEIDDSVFQLK